MAETNGAAAGVQQKALPGEAPAPEVGFGGGGGPAQTATATRGRAMFDGQLLAQLWRMAQIFAAAEAVPKALRGKVNDVFLVLMNGYELGMSPAASLRGIHVVDGKPLLDAALLRGLFLADSPGNEIEVLESTDKVCRLRFKRKGRKEHIHSWTIEQAAAAGLVAKDNWRKYTAEMLLARCSATGLRSVVAPDLFAGVYVDGEIEVNEAPAAGVSAPPAGPGRVVDLTAERAAQQQRAGAAQPAAAPQAAAQPSAPELPPAQPRVTIDPPEQRETVAVRDTQTGPLFTDAPAKEAPAPDAGGDFATGTPPTEARQIEAALNEALEGGNQSALGPIRKRIEALAEGNEKAALKVLYNDARKAILTGGAR